MDTDLQRLSNPLERIVRDENQNSSGETKIYFDNLHLSPLKVKPKEKRNLLIKML